MKKLFLAIIGVIVLIVLALVIEPTARDEIHWRWASHEDDMTRYESYLKVWPKGRHFEEATRKMEAHDKEIEEAKRNIEVHDREKAFSGINDALLAKLNGEPSFVASIGGSTVSKGLISGKFSIGDKGQYVIGAGAKVVYNFDEVMQVIGTAGADGRLASVDEVHLKKGASIEFKNGQHYVYDGQEWVRR